MSKPTISVIIPAYRAASTIGRAVDSVLRQQVGVDEILVIDDGSPDDMASALVAYGEKVQLIRKSNGGAASARNLGLDRARGDLIAFLDADDYWEPDRLSSQLEVMQRFPEVGLVASRLFREFPGGGRILPPGRFPGEYFDRPLFAKGAEVLLTATFISTPTVLARRDLIGSMRFDTTLKTAEDVDFWIRLVMGFPVYIISRPLATAVLLMDSLSRRDASDDFPNMLRVVHRYTSLLGPDELRWWESKVYRDWAASHLGKGEPREALSPAWNRVKRQPWSLQGWWIVIKACVWSWVPFSMSRVGCS